MKPETILDAMMFASIDSSSRMNPKYKQRRRQYRAFRARILRLDAEKDAEIARLKKSVSDYEKEWAMWRDSGSPYPSKVVKEWNTPEEDEVWKDL